MTQPSGEDWDAYRKLCTQNATCFDEQEQRHPINFFEQRDVCRHCGAERFITMDKEQCCAGAARCALSHAISPKSSRMCSRRDRQSEHAKSVAAMPNASSRRGKPHSCSNSHATRVMNDGEETA